MKYDFVNYEDSEEKKEMLKRLEKIEQEIYDIEEKYKDVLESFLK